MSLSSGATDQITWGVLYIRKPNVGDQEAAYGPVAFHKNRKPVEERDNCEKDQTCPGQVRLKRAAEPDVLGTHALGVQCCAETCECVADRHPGN